MNQSIKEFFTSKTNIAGLGLIGLGAYLMSEQQYNMGMMAITNGLGFIGVRDALAK